ncbi:MAG: hypothetical protein WAK93_21185 [Solirubrobacteraceae bacterium]
MSGSTEFRSLSFGDVDGALWGGAVEFGTPALAFGATAGTAALTDELEWSVDGACWVLSGDGVDLRVEPGGEELDPLSPPASTEVTGLEELCRVQGTVMLDGADRVVSCVGTRCVVDRIEPTAVASLRAVSGWFSDDEAFALLAFRASRGRGHESDLVAATLFDPEGWVAVSDPRLSTTYAASGEPVRTNLELWIGDGENEYPRRAAGEVSGPAAVASRDGLELRVAPLRCHSRGRDGSGVYVLASFQ